MALNEVIHQPIRLRLMAALTTLPRGSQIEFTSLRRLLQLTDGNLSVHLRRLEEAGYVCLSKTFVQRKPCTYVVATEQGRRAFQAYRAELEHLLMAPEGVVSSADVHPHDAASPADVHPHDAAQTEEEG
jgi:DNA-binding MarR family transcriptional regulator